MATTRIGQIEPFEIGSNDWELYAEWPRPVPARERYQRGEKEGNIIAILVTVIGQKAYVLLQNLLAPTKPHKKKYIYAELVEEMKNHLQPKLLTIAKQFKFNQRK